MRALSIKESQEHIHQLQHDIQGFRKLAELLKNWCGIHLIENEKNITLMATRLSSVLNEFSIQTYSEFVKVLLSGNAKAKNSFTFALTTNTTQFFRENEHFNYLRTHFSEYLSYKKQRHDYDLRVWCAAASTGQEVYSLLMVLLDILEPNLLNFDFKILATDIDLDVLSKASQGLYLEKEMDNVSAFHKQKYFAKVDKSNIQYYQFLPNYQKYIRFAQLNLVSSTYPFQNTFDIIFCRNVLIYFDTQTAVQVVNNLAKFIRPNGQLFLGHSETSVAKLESFKNISHAVYQKQGPNG